MTIFKISIELTDDGERSYMEHELVISNELMLVEKYALSRITRYYGEETEIDGEGVFGTTASAPSPDIGVAEIQSITEVRNMPIFNLSTSKWETYGLFKSVYGDE